MRGRLLKPTSLRRRLAGAAVLVLVLGAAMTGTTGTPAGAFGPPLHEDITRKALPFLAPGVLQEIVDGNVSQDSGISDKTSETHHFDSCFFNGSTKYIRNGYADLVKSLDARARPKALERAYHLGRISHPIQDFYAHSNWVEHNRSDLLDAGVGPWRVLRGWETIRDDLVVGQGESLPAGWRKRNGPPRSNVWIRDGVLRHVIITGYVEASFPIPDSAVDDDCHDDLDFSHSQLNKDGANRPGFSDAWQLARRQMQHEWCRLLRLSRAEDGDAGPGALLGLWVSPGASAHPARTRCAARPGRQGWTVQVSRIKVKDPRDGDAAGQVNLRSVLYARNLRGSSVAGVGPVSVAPNQAVPTDRLPARQTLCTSSGFPPVAAVHGWDDDAGSRSGVLDEAPIPPPIGGSVRVDDVLDGVSLRIRSAGTFIRTSPDLVVTFKVRRNNNCGG